MTGEHATGTIDLSIDPDKTEAGFDPSLGEGTQTYTDIVAGDDEFIYDTDKTLDDDVSLTAKQVEGDRPYWWNVAGAAQQMNPETGEMVMWPPSGGDLHRLLHLLNLILLLWTKKM